MRHYGHLRILEFRTIDSLIIVQYGLCNCSTYDQFAISIYLWNSSTAPSSSPE
jgi:hypothetical protein